MLSPSAGIEQRDKEATWGGSSVEAEDEGSDRGREDSAAAALSPVGRAVSPRSIGLDEEMRKWERVRMGWKTKKKTEAERWALGGRWPN